MGKYDKEQKAILKACINKTVLNIIKEHEADYEALVIRFTDGSILRIEAQSDNDKRVGFIHLYTCAH